MHEIEPFYEWCDFYVASEDRYSPFYGREYSEFELTNAIYNYLIHPQWDHFGSATLYLKLLMVNDEKQYAIIELIGEWNDTLYNDIMYLYQEVIEPLFDRGIIYYILIGENVLNFHADTSDYYEEWSDNLGDGWIVCLNFRKHLIDEFTNASIDFYMAMGGKFNELNWRAYSPDELFNKVNMLITKRLNP